MDALNTAERLKTFTRSLIPIHIPLTLALSTNSSSACLLARLFVVNIIQILSLTSEGLKSASITNELADD